MGHWWGGNPHAAEGPGHFPEDEQLGVFTEAIAGRLIQQDQVRRLQKAITFAIDAHFIQRDKAGEAYIWHPLRVGISLLPDVDAAIVGVLHDVLEDCDVTYTDCLKALWGDTELYEDLVAVTQVEGEPYLRYIMRCAQRPRAVKVKLADIKDNLDPRRFEAACKVTDRSKMVTLHQKYMNAEWILNHIAN